MPELVDLLEALFTMHGHRVTREAALEGRSGTVYTVPLLAEAEAAILVTGEFAGMVLEASEVTEFLASVEDTGADRGVLCHAGAVTAAARTAAGERILLWGRDQMVRLLGEMQLAQALGEMPPALPLQPSAPSDVGSLAEAVSDLMPAAFRIPEIVAEPESDYALPEIEADLLSIPMLEPEPISAPVQPDAFDVVIPPIETDPFQPFPTLAQPLSLPEPAQVPFEVPQLPGVQRLVPPMGARVHSLAPLVAAAAATQTPTATYAPLTGSPVRATPITQGPPVQVMHAPAMMPAGPKAETARHQSRQMLPVRITPEEARRRVKDKLFSVEHVELILHPVHLFDYECDVLKEGSLNFDTLDGRMQVHGSDKTTLDVDPDQANPEAPTLLQPNHAYATTERVLRIPAERALQLATAHVMAKFTRNVDVRVPDHNNSLFYTEKRKVAPTPDQVRVVPMGIFFRPAWRLHGGNGQLDLDAVDGRELFAELRNSRTDSMIVD